MNCEKKNFENFDGFSIIHSLDSQVSCHSLKPVSFQLKDSQNDEKSGIIFNVFRQLDHIRDDFLRIQREIQVVHTQQGIKNVRLEKLLIDSSVFEQKVNKFQQKVAGLNENIRNSEKIVEKLENVQKGLEKGEERCRDILAKLTEVENLKGFKEFLDFSR